MPVAALESKPISVDEVRNVSVNMSGKLDVGETLTGTPTITAPNDMTITNPQVNSAAIYINGVSVAIGKAIQFSVEPSEVGSRTIVVASSTSAGQTVDGELDLTVI